MFPPTHPFIVWQKLVEVKTIAYMKVFNAFQLFIMRQKLVEVKTIAYIKVFNAFQLFIITVSNPDTNYSGSGCILTHEKYLALVMQLE